MLDLARVLEIEPDGSRRLGVGALGAKPRSTRTGACSSGSSSSVRCSCSFAVRLDVRDHPSDPLRATLPLILAADRFALAFDGAPDQDRPLVWVAAPAARECVFEVLAAVGV